MLRSLRWPLAVAVAGFVATQAFALGADHPREELARRGPNCVHGFFVNWTDVFFFTGDAAACNKFVADAVAEAAKEKGKVVRVVLHPGPKNARSPWDKADRNLPVEWSLTTGGVPAVVGRKEVLIDVWIGGKIRLDELRFPAEAEVASGGEIERFLAEHGKQKQ